jgi:hypothetical protein
MRLSQLHDLSQGFGVLTLIDLGFFFVIFLIDFFSISSLDWLGNKLYKLF